MFPNLLFIAAYIEVRRIIPLRVERAAIFNQPANVDHLAWRQTHLIRRVARLNDEVVFASNPKACAEDVTHIDELKHFSLQGMCVVL